MTYQLGTLKSILPERLSKEKATMEAILDPRVGDSFTEILAYWVFVVHRDGNTVWYLDGNPPISFPEEGRLVRTTLDNFIKKFTYSSAHKSSWLRLEKRGVNVAGWDTCNHKEEIDQ